MTELILEEIKKIGSAIEGLKVDISALKTDVAALKTDVAALKVGLENLRGEVDYIKENFVTKKHFEKSVKMLVTRFEFEDFQEHVYENMFTKKDWMNHIEFFDDVISEHKSTKINNALIGNQYVDLDNRVASHEKRITKLEFDKV